MAATRKQKRGVMLRRRRQKPVTRTRRGGRAVPVTGPVTGPANNNTSNNNTSNNNTSNNNNSNNNGFNLEYHCRSLQSSLEALSEEIELLREAGDKASNNTGRIINEKEERLVNIEEMIRRDCHSTSTRYVDGGKRKVKRRATRRPSTRRH
jgi:hypothetical protein